MFGHNLIGMENGDLLLIGGYDKDSEAYQSKVWRLSSATWTEEATLQKVFLRNLKLGILMEKSRKIKFLSKFGKFIITTFDPQNINV